MTVKVFVDTNVILQYLFQAAPLHREAQALVNNWLGSNAELWINRQVIREYLSQATRKQSYLPDPLSAEEAAKQLDILTKIVAVADDTAAVTSRLIALLKQFPTGGKQVHDANIVATMQENNITTLLTRNVEDMRRFETLITIVPLEANLQAAGPDSPETR